MRHHLRRATALVGAAGLVLGLAACAESEREAEGEGEQAQESTFVFAASADPKSLDPAFASDGESFRVSRQIFEGLTATEPGTADPAPNLATEWTVSDDGLTYVFQLQEGVTFHDGTPFDAAAVCANFDRWYGFTGVLQSQNVSYYWQNLFKGFAQNEAEGLSESVYGGCEASGDLEATITLTTPFAGFVSALSLPAFAMSSPTALEEYDADEVTGTGEAPQFGPYANEHPTGTGPYVFESWERGSQLVLTANEDYWGGAPEVDRVIFRVIDDPNARRQALQSENIDGYDLVAPADVEPLSADYEIVDREPFNVLYLAFNQALPELADVRVRQAIAHAVNKEALVQQTLPEGTTVATQFIPDLVAGYNEDVPTYAYDPDRARQLLAEAGQSDLTLDFNYPTGVSRPYMPTPEQVFTAISADLEAVGITVNPQPDTWSPDYLDRVTGSEDHGIHLLGWTGDYNDTDNFLGVFFGAPSLEWGFDNPELFADLAQARSLPTVEEQVPLYEQINADVMEFLPGVPLAHPVPSLAFDPSVQDYPASPVQDEVYDAISIESGR